jgi:hypothetical protein
MDIAWHPSSRIATIRCTAGAMVDGEDGRVLVEALTAWVGPRPVPFAVIADATGVPGTDAEYRSTVREFFARHRDHAYIALVNMGPVLRVIAEMFRIGSGVQLRGFASDDEARQWLRDQGIAA